MNEQQHGPMEISEAQRRPEMADDKKAMDSYTLYIQLLAALRLRELPPDTISSINYETELLNAVPASEAKAWHKQVSNSRTQIIRLLEKKHKLVVRHHYRNTWMAVGMAAFGVPMGVAFGASLDNMAFIGIGIPIGMVIGMGIGAAMDQKAAEEGRQLDVEA
jgi:hypothetical protein